MYNVIIVTTFAISNEISLNLRDDVVVEVFTFDTEEQAKAFANDVKANSESLPNRKLAYVQVCEVNEAITIEQYKETLAEELA